MPTLLHGFQCKAWVGAITMPGAPLVDNLHPGLGNLEPDFQLMMSFCAQESQNGATGAKIMRIGGGLLWVGVTFAWG